MRVILQSILGICLAMALTSAAVGSEVRVVSKLITEERATLWKMFVAGKAAEYIDAGLARRFGAVIRIEGNLTLGQYILCKSLYKERVAKVAQGQLRNVTQIQATDATIIFVKHLAETRPTVFNALKNDTAKLDALIDDVHDLFVGSLEDLAAGRNPGRNAGIDAYALANILGDGRKVALPGAGGPLKPNQVSYEELLELVRTTKGVEGIKSRNFRGRARGETGHVKIMDTDSVESGWKGALYELRCLRRFLDGGDEIIRIRAKVHEDDVLLTDIDIFLRRGGTSFAVQAKATRGALGSPRDFVENCTRMSKHKDILGPGHVSGLDKILPRCKLAMPAGEAPSDEFIDKVWRMAVGNGDEVLLGEQTISTASGFRTWFRANVVEELPNSPIIP